MTVKTCEEQIELHKGNPELLNFWTSKRARMVAKYDKYAHLRVQPKPEPKEPKKDGKKPKR